MRTRTHFEALALPHLRSVYGLARQMAGQDRAEDLVPEILHNAWVSQWRKTRLELPVGDLDEAPAEPAYDWERERLSASCRQTCNGRSISCRRPISGRCCWLMSKR